MNNGCGKKTFPGVRAVYISYYGLTQPLLHSQGLPYIKGLAGKGIDFTVVSFEKKEFQEKEAIKRLRAGLSEAGIKWKYLTYHRSPRFLATLYDVFTGFFAVFYIVLKNRINIIHARSTMPAVIGYTVAFILRRKFIIDVRGLMAYEYADAGTLNKNSMLFRILDSVEKFFIARADGVVVLTEKIAGIFRNGYIRFRKKNINMKIIPCCVDLNNFNRSSGTVNTVSQGKPLFVYVGSVGTWYKLDEMLDFFKAAKKRWHQAALLMVAHTDHEFIAKKLEEHGIKTEDIKLTSSDYTKIGCLISQADAGLFFCMGTFSKQASSPTKLAEYLACGLPVVVNAGVGDVAEVVRSNDIGVVLEDFSQASYEKALDELDGYFKSDSEELSKKCRSVAESYYDLNKAVELYGSLYDAALTTGITV